MTTMARFRVRNYVWIMTLVLGLFVGMLRVDIERNTRGFERVSTVMSKSPVPYVHLDEKDEIYDYNQAFATFWHIPLKKPEI